VRLYLRASERRPDPEPLRTDDRKAVLVGTAVWAGMLAATLALRADLVAQGRGWWVWTCIAGAGLGLAGLAFVHHREVRQRSSTHGTDRRA
jgi:Protein of unknown function (DUF2530)